jgi:hypothetical protein
MAARMGYPSPGLNRSHLMEQAQLPSQYHHPYHSGHHVNENLYHIGEIFNPNKSASVNNGLSDGVYQSGDPEDSNFLPQQSMCPLIDREIQSSLPSLAASDSTSCNLYAEAEDVIPPGNYFSGHSSGGSGGNSGSSGNGGNNPHGLRPTKNSRSTSPAYSSDSFNSGKSGSKRLYNSKGSKKKFDNSSCKSLERRHLAPLLPGRNGK